MADLYNILQTVTVDCKDNQQYFTITDRIDAIAQLLDRSAYSICHKGDLCRIYAKKPVDGKPIILISSHTDCVYKKLFCIQKDNGLLHGTFDNSLTNACVISAMLEDKLAANVVIAFTGDEEKDSNGAKEVAGWLAEHNATPVLALVLDVSNEGWNEGCVFTIENDLGIDMITAHKIIQTLDNWGVPYGFIHQAEPDESWDYIDLGIPSMTLCIPIEGDMHSDKGCLARMDILPIFSEALQQITKALNSEE